MAAVLTPRAPASTDALVIHPGALGDVLLAVPALRALRARGARITIAAQPRIGALLVTLRVADRSVGFDGLGLEALFGDAAPAPDASLSRHLREAGRVVCWFGARDDGFVRRLHALAPDAVIAAPVGTTERVWQHLLRTAGDGEADCQPIALEPALLDEGRRALRTAGWDGRSPVLVVHPGAGGVAKRWPADGFVAIVRDLEASIVVHRGPADAEAVAAFTARLPAACLIEPPLPALAGALASATAYVGNDSGVSHLAAAVGTRALVLFTDGARPWVPWSPTARCLTVATGALAGDDVRTAAAALRELL